MLLSTNFRISQKIMLLVAGLAAGFVAIGVAYFVQMTTEQAIQEQRSQLIANGKLLDSVRVDIIELNGLLLEFVALRDSSLLDKSSELKKTLLNKVTLLNALGDEIGISGDLQSIEGLVRSYDDNYQKAVAELLRLGDVGGDGLFNDLVAKSDSTLVAVSNSGEKSLISQFLPVLRLQSAVIKDPSNTGLANLQDSVQVFADQVSASNLSQPIAAELIKRLSSYQEALLPLGNAISGLQTVDKQLKQTGEQLTDVISLAGTHLNEYADKITSETEYKSQLTLALFVGLSFGVVMAMAIGVFLIYKSIVFPMAHIQNVIRRINKGQLKARVKLTQSDELGDLGRAFNILLDERIRTLEEQSLENEQLNNSIISLIRALGQIAQKNLTIKVPVSADITGTISDAVNLLTTETAKTLGQVRGISEQVNDISDLLQAQSANVLRVAEDERKQVMATSKALDLAARAMNEIAARAETADKIATKTIADTQQARDAVMKSVSGILTIRETISETEKRMKRLGDRSQEISGIVNLINTIAERTHILALNASMHAASAGEAGKGFAVVADEVQRLAENAREATAEISSMVNNIRIETSDTVNIMNQLITDVAQGTRLAEQAGKRMDITEEATRQLVETVKAIAHSSVHQAQIANKIRDRAIIIRNFTEKTGGELIQQKRHTDNLKQYSEALLERVGVFELPESQLVSKAELALEVEPIKNVG